MAKYPTIISPDGMLTVDQLDALTSDQIAILAPEHQAQLMNRLGHKRALNRRRFLGGLAASGVAVAGAGLLAGCGNSSNPGATPNPIAAGASETDVLNFALNLEYLEASFYLYATTGTGLTAADMGTSPGTVTGGVQTTFTDPETQAYAQQITKDEVNHVEFLRSALGPAAVSIPALNLAAIGSFATQVAFLQIARAFEDTGVSAYGGAVTLLTAGNLQAAAQIGLVEAYHASAVRTLVIQQGITSPATDSLDVPPTPATYFPVTSQSLAIIRSTSQVLMIVYATTASGASSGGFFPQGLNGNIKTI